MMERGIWPMLRLVLLGSQRRSIAVGVLVGGSLPPRPGVAQRDRENGLLFDRAPVRSFLFIGPR